MSGPHVAGIIALMREACPDCDPQTLKELLLETAIDSGYPPQGEDNTFGMGLINAFGAVSAALELSEKGFVDGYISDETGTPIQSAHVQAINEHTFANTDLHGYYCLRAQPGTYNLRFTAFGYDAQTEENVQVFEDDTTHLNMVMPISPQGILSGIVQMQSGTVLPNAVITFRLSSLDSITTDSTGSFLGDSSRIKLCSSSASPL